MRAGTAHSVLLRNVANRRRSAQHNPSFGPISVSFPVALTALDDTLITVFIPNRSALLNMNYKVSLTHAATNSFKTNASPAAVWDIMRKFVKKHPVKMAAFAQDAPGLAILSGEMRYIVEP